MLRFEMKQEINSLKQRLARCERANRDLVNRFDSAPWRISEEMKKKHPKQLDTRFIEEPAADNKKRHQNDRLSLTVYEQVADSPRGGFGSNYETNA